MNQEQSYEVLGNDRECEPGLRNRYYMGKRMTPSTFQTEQEYHVSRRRLINRAVLGWGVVQGFKVESADGALTIGAGLALDQAGHELVQVGERRLAPADAFVLDEHRAALQGAQEGRCWLLRAHYAERCEVAVGGDPCHCDHDEWEYVREVVAYSLHPTGCEHCEAPPEPGKRYCEHCGEGAHLGTAGDRGPHHCLCHALEERHDEGDGELYRMGRNLRGDLHHGVPLACVTIVKQDGCDELAFGTVKDSCAIRRLVIGNHMLYDLIRGRDLTRIESISWRGWPESLPWHEFAHYFPHPETGITGFKITFSGPVRKATIKADCFVIRVAVTDERTGWEETLRVPLLEPGYDEHSHTVILRADPDWVRDEIVSRKSAFRDGALVEIEVRGDFIIDSCGQAVDANAIGRRLPSGNGTPGGTFLSTFRVIPGEGRHQLQAPAIDLSEQSGDQP